MQKRRQQHGFTLIELLIVLVIMVGVAAVAVPRFAKAMTYVELRKSTQQLAASLRDARNRSIIEARTAEVILNTERQFLRVREQGIVLDWSDDIHVSLDGSEMSPSVEEWSIRFYPDGTASNVSLSVVALERRYQVSVDWLTGRVRVL